MFRTPVNRLFGRKKSLREIIKYDDAVNLLKNLGNKDIIKGINMGWKKNKKHGDFGMSPEKAIQKLENCFPPSLDRSSCTGDHQVFINKKGEENHYIVLEYKKARDVSNGQIAFYLQSRKAKINYSLGK